MGFSNVGGAEVEINLGPLETKELERNKLIAQKKLNLRIVKDSEPYVPMKSGRLRRSVTFPEGAYGEWIEYGTHLPRPYARYQYFGEVYGPNIPVFKGDRIVGWRSKSPKRPTGRELGVPGTWKGWKFGYTTNGTQHHWFDEAKNRHMNDWVNLVRRTLILGE